MFRQYGIRRLYAFALDAVLADYVRHPSFCFDVYQLHGPEGEVVVLVLPFVDALRGMEHNNSTFIGVDHPLRIHQTETSTHPGLQQSLSNIHGQLPFEAAAANLGRPALSIVIVI
jgi:hypothetical protein